MEHQDHQPPPPPRMKPPENQNHRPPPPQKCPRCESTNTKFCYYNNYSLTQPRYFCKACRRYWTQGGTLRNVPVGGGCRKSKRPKPSIASSSSSSGPQSLPPAYPSHSYPGPDPGQGSGIRPLPPAIPGTSFYSGGSFLSTLAGMQSLAPPGGGAAANMGGGNGQYEASLALLMKPQQFQVQNEYFPTRPPPPMSWTQSFINRAPAATTSAAVGSEFWSGGATSNQAGSSFNPNQWAENNNGFDASQNSGT